MSAHSSGSSEGQITVSRLASVLLAMMWSMGNANSEMYDGIIQFSRNGLRPAL